MFKSINKLYDNRLLASDGDIGKVIDFYFDDRNWIVRYVVIDPEKKQNDKQVLLTPHAFSSLHQAKKFLPVNLTRKEIENSPTIDTHMPISRQFEEEYYRYYGWPAYWDGKFIWGKNALPADDAPSPSLTRIEEGKASDDPREHLRCTKAITGYNIESKEGISGKVIDFILDVQTWEIRKLVVKLGGWFSRQEIDILTSDVIRINYLESTIHVDLSLKEIQECPDHFANTNELVH